MAELRITYSGEATTSGFDFAVLGESFIGFDSVVKEFFEISKVNGELDFKTMEIRRGSIDVINSLTIAINTTPFTDIKHLYEFLRIVDVQALKVAEAFFSDINSAHRTVNDYFVQNPFDNNLVTAFIVYLIGRFISQGRGRFDTSQRIDKSLRSMLERKKFKKALRPLTESGFDNIKLAALSKGEVITSVTISDTHLPDFLPEDEQLLPELINGKSIRIRARVVGLLSTRGEVVKLLCYDLQEEPIVIVGRPPYGDEVSIYKDYYGSDVIIEAEVVRQNMFKKPELNIVAMYAHQIELKFEDSDKHD